MKFLVFLLFLTDLAHAHVQLSEYELSRRVQAKSNLPDHVKRYFSKGQFHLRGGYGSSLDLANLLYFVPVAQTLKKHEISVAPILPSKARRSISDGSKDNYDSLMETRDPNKPSHLVGHSMGATIQLLTVLEHPELIEQGIVDLVFPVQGVISGNALSDKLGGRGQTWLDSALSFLTLPFGAGAKSLETREVYNTLSDAASRLSFEQLKMISEHIVFITSTASKKNTSLAYKGAQALLGEDSDGLVKEPYMFFDGFGRRIRINEADHGSLVMTLPGFSNWNANQISAAWEFILENSVSGEVLDNPCPIYMAY